MTDRIIIGQRIAELRKNKGLTQAELADLIGVSHQAVSQWERSETLPDILTLPKLAEIFNESLSAIMGMEEPKPAVVENSEKNDNDVSEISVESKPEISFKVDDVNNSVNDGGGCECGNGNGEKIDFHKDEYEFVIRKNGVEIKSFKQNPEKFLKVTIKGNVYKVNSSMQINVDGNVMGDATSGFGMNITGDVGGNVKSGFETKCGNIQGDVTAGFGVKCGDIAGRVRHKEDGFKNSSSGNSDNAAESVKNNNIKNTLKNMFKGELKLLESEENKDTESTDFDMDDCTKDIDGVNTVIIKGDMSGSITNCVNVKVEGDFNGDSIECTGSVTVNGDSSGDINADGDVAVGSDCGGDVEAGGSVTIGCDCGGDIDAGGSVNIGGDCDGDVDAGGNVTVDGDCEGDIDAGNYVEIGGDCNGDVDGEIVKIHGDFDED